jgi:hypothetical protein
MDKGRATKYIKNNARLSAKDAFLLTEKELRRLNSIVNKNKLSDTAIANVIFNKLRGEIAEQEIEIFAKTHFAAGYYSFLDLKEKMIKENCFNYVGIRKYGFIINELLYDIMIFANHIGQKNDSQYSFFNGWKATIEDSRWHNLGTFQLAYYSIFKDKRLDNKFALILTPVALRQTIELKMNRIVGIGDLFDRNGQKIFTKHNFIFDFIKRNKNLLELNIDIKLINKIFEFCNDSVHKGIMPYFWQIFYALRFCDDLFYDPNFKKATSVHSAVKIKDYSLLKSNLEKELIKQFPSPNYDLHIQWIKPEAQIIK